MTIYNIKNESSQIALDGGFSELSVKVVLGTQFYYYSLRS